MQIGLPLGVSRRGGNGSGGGGGGGVGIAFDTATATAGVTFSNNNVTANNTTGGNIASAQATVSTPSGYSNTYVEFIIGNLNDQFFGFAQASTWTSNASPNRVGINANSVALQLTTGSIWVGGTVRLNPSVILAVGDVLGISCLNTQPSNQCTFKFYRNGTEFASYDAQSYVTPGSVFIPVWSANTVGAFCSISNSAYAAPATYTPLGSPLVSASASVTPVADGKYDVYTFNASGTFTTTGTGAVRALVIAGGGGGGNAYGGGGAGGYQEKGVVTTPQTYAITVGAGGGNGTPGINSSIGSALVSTGGGTGAQAGGSGGGGGTEYTGTYAPPGSGIAGQGYNGGGGSSGGGPNYDFGVGGGGGAGGAGGTINGGIGLSSSITGTSVARAGGGNGTTRVNYSTTYGSTTGFGQAFSAAATANTGTGGFASGFDQSGGSAGGSGVVIIRVRARA